MTAQIRPAAEGRGLHEEHPLLQCAHCRKEWLKRPHTARLTRLESGEVPPAALLREIFRAALGGAVLEGQDRRGEAETRSDFRYQPWRRGMTREAKHAVVFERQPNTERTHERKRLLIDELRGYRRIHRTGVSGHTPRERARRWTPHGPGMRWRRCISQRMASPETEGGRALQMLLGIL